MTRALAARLDALDTVVRLGRGRFPDPVVEDATSLSARAGERLRLSGEHTVVALAGATGSGKSSLFNAIARAPLATVGVRRPTTSATQACVLGPDGAGPLLDWLQVGSRWHGDAATTPELSGLVLLDLPDHDSTEAAHRAEVDRLVRLVDAFVWVLDPQKYADGVLHEEYLRPLAAHRDVMAVVLNQADRLSAPDVEACLRDLRRLLAEDGLTDVPLFATSALTPEGALPLNQFLALTVSDHRARTSRIGGDLDDLARRLGPLVPKVKEATLDPAALSAAFGRAAGVPAVVDAVGRAYVHRALAAVGWPPVRWLSRFRPDPLRRLGIGRPGSGASGSPDGAGSAEVLGRTSMPAASSVSRAEVDTAIRAVATVATAGRPDPWPRMFLAAARSRREEIPDALDRAVGGADLGMDRPPRWWRIGGFVQWALLAVAVTGALWLALLFGLAYLQIDLDAPDLGPFAWPTVLLFGGLLGGLLLRVLARPFVAVGANRRRRRAARTLRRRIAASTTDLVLEPVQREQGVAAELSSAVRHLSA